MALNDDVVLPCCEGEELAALRSRRRCHSPSAHGHSRQLLSSGEIRNDCTRGTAAVAPKHCGNRWPRSARLVQRLPGGAQWRYQVKRGCRGWFSPGRPGALGVLSWRSAALWCRSAALRVVLILQRPPRFAKNHVGRDDTLDGARRGRLRWASPGSSGQQFYLGASRRSVDSMRTSSAAVTGALGVRWLTH